MGWICQVPQILVLAYSCWRHSVAGQARGGQSFECRCYTLVSSGHVSTATSFNQGTVQHPEESGSQTHIAQKATAVDVAGAAA